MEDLSNNQIVGEKDTATPKLDSPSIQKTDTKQVAQQKTQKAINNDMLDGMPGKNDTQLVKSAFSGDVKGYRDALNKPSEALSAYNSKAAGLMGFDEKNPPIKMDVNDFKKEFKSTPDKWGDAGLDNSEEDTSIYTYSGYDGGDDKTLNQDIQIAKEYGLKAWKEQDSDGVWQLMFDGPKAQMKKYIDEYLGADSSGL